MAEKKNDPLTIDQFKAQLRALAQIGLILNSMKDGREVQIPLPHRSTFEDIDSILKKAL